MANNKISLHETVNLSSVVLFQPSVVTPLLIDEEIEPSGEKIIHFGNDATLLLNQHRLSSLGSDTIRNYLDSLAPSSSALSQIRSKVSDDDLINYVKSRYIQSPAELSAWIGSLDETAQQIVSEIQNKSIANETSETINTAPEAPAPSDSSNVQS